jgi:hypothetical protein
LDKCTTPTSQSSAAGLAGQDTASSTMCRGTRGRRVESMIIGKVNLTRCVCWICVLTPTRTDKKLKKREEAASRRLIAETTKQCPGCKGNIEKSFGCDHMSCKVPSLSYCHALHTHSYTLFSPTYNSLANTDVRSGTRCGKEFCWQCFAPYARMRCAHRPGCEYHSFYTEEEGYV